jgi:hypothetical protein
MSTTQSTRAGDDRFTIGLISDVFDVLEKHGYRRPEGDDDANLATGKSVEALLNLIETFEGHR